MHNDSGRLSYVLIINKSFDKQVVKITLEIISISFKIWTNHNPCVHIKIWKYQPNPSIRFWAMMILRIRVSNHLIFCYMSCHAWERQKHNLSFDVHCSKTMRWIYLIIVMTNCHIPGFDLPFIELIYLIWFLCKSRLNTGDRTLDTLYIVTSPELVQLI